MRIRYAIKKEKTGRYLTENLGWSKDIMKADLLEFDQTEYKLCMWPELVHCKKVIVKETYSREEVKE